MPLGELVIEVLPFYLNTIRDVLELETMLFAGMPLPTTS